MRVPGVFHSCRSALQAIDSGLLPRMQRGGDAAPLPAAPPALHQSVTQKQENRNTAAGWRGCGSLSPGKQSVSEEEPACVFCFFSLPTTGYLYSLRGGVELLSTYHYPDKVLEAMLTDYLLHVITKYDGGLCLHWYSAGLTQKAFDVVKLCLAGVRCSLSLCTVQQ